MIYFYLCLKRGSLRLKCMRACWYFINFSQIPWNKINIIVRHRMLDNLLVYQEKGWIPNKEFSLFLFCFFSLWVSMHGLLCCKRACFILQKVLFYTSKGHLLHCKRASFKSLFLIYCFSVCYKLAFSSIPLRWEKD